MTAGVAFGSLMDSSDCQPSRCFAVPDVIVPFNPAGPEFHLLEPGPFFLPLGFRLADQFEFLRGDVFSPYASRSPGWSSIRLCSPSRPSGGCGRAQMRASCSGVQLNDLPQMGLSLLDEGLLPAPVRKFPNERPPSAAARRRDSYSSTLSDRIVRNEKSLRSTVTVAPESVSSVTDSCRFVRFLTILPRSSPRNWLDEIGGNREPPASIARIASDQPPSNGECRGRKHRRAAEFSLPSPTFRSRAVRHSRSFYALWTERSNCEAALYGSS